MLSVQKDFAVDIKTRKSSVRIPSSGSMDIAAGAYAILPFFFSMECCELEYVTAQLVTRAKKDGRPVYIFTVVDGMKPEAVFRDNVDIRCLSGCSTDGSGKIDFDAENGGTALVNGNFYIVVLSVKDAMRLWQIDAGDERLLFLSDFPVLFKNGRFYLEYHSGQDVEIAVLSSRKEYIEIGGVRLGQKESNGLFTVYESYRGDSSPSVDFVDASSRNDDSRDGGLKRPVVGSPITSSKVVNARGIFHFSASDFDGAKQLMLRIDYSGDIGYAFINGRMIHDNFCNGRTWEIDLMPYKEEILKHGLYVYVSPHKEGSYIDSSSAMAAMVEVAGKQTAEIYAVSAERVEDIDFSF